MLKPKRWTVYCKEWSVRGPFSQEGAFYLYKSLEELVESQKSIEFDENSANTPVNGNEVVLLEGKKKLYEQVKFKSLCLPHKEVEKMVYEARRLGCTIEAPLGWESRSRSLILVSPVAELPPVKSEKYHNPYEGEWDILEGPDRFDLMTAVFMAFVVHFRLFKKEKGPEWYERDDDTQTWVVMLLSIERVGLPRDEAWLLKGVTYPRDSIGGFRFDVEADYNHGTRKGVMRISCLTKKINY